MQYTHLFSCALLYPTCSPPHPQSQHSPLLTIPIACCLNLIPILWHSLMFLDYLDVENGGSRLLRIVEKYFPVDMPLRLRRLETTVQHQFCVCKGHSPYEGKHKCCVRWERLFSSFFWKISVDCWSCRTCSLVSWCMKEDCSRCGPCWNWDLYKWQVSFL